MRQKELDRQSARQLVAQDTDRELKEMKMTVHRINRVSVCVSCDIYIYVCVCVCVYVCIGSARYTPRVEGNENDCS